MANRVGIRAVALAAGVSVTTVSHALSGRGQVSAGTRRRVEAVARDLGYAPNRIASALRGGPTRVLGFVSEEVVTSPFAGRILAGAQEAALEQGRLLMIVNVDRDAADAAPLELLLAQHVDAVLFASMHHRVLHAPKALRDADAVLVDAEDAHGALPAVVPDEVGIGLLATRRLLEAGHRQISHVTLDLADPAVDGRIRGYRIAMGEAGATPHVVRVPGAVADAPAGRVGVRRAIAERAATTAVFAFNDQMSMGVYQEARGDVLRLVPTELSVVGVDNLDLVAAAVLPGLTTIALPHHEMGRRATELALRLADGDTGVPTSISVPGVLVERDSVAPPLFG